MTKKNRYDSIIERIFLSKYTAGAREIAFERQEIERVAKQLRIVLPKNLGDVIYSFRYRAALPQSITSRAPKGTHWIIRPAGRSKYCFHAAQAVNIVPNPLMTEARIPDATPGVIEMYALSDEQALLAKLRYNRLVDIFTGVTCYSLQSHLRTFVPEVGQVETDEMYVGVDRRGAHYIFPVQAKGGRDKLNIVQIEQDFSLCAKKFPSLLCRPIAAQFMADNLIAMFSFEQKDGVVAITAERHYRLANPEELSAEELRTYQLRPMDA